MTTNQAVERSQMVKDSAHYLASTIFSQAVALLRVVVMPIFLGPVALGTWNLMGVTVGYGANAHFGILHGFNKTLPALRALGKQREGDELKDSVLWACLALGLAFGSLLFGLSFAVGADYAEPLRIISVVVALQMMFVFYVCLLRADSRFALLSTGLAAQSISSTMLVVLLAYLFHDPLAGALVGLAPAYLIVIGYWHFKGGYRFATRPQWAPIKDAFHVGLPLIVLGFVDMMLLSVDRWVIAWQLPGTALGFYALGIMASGLLGLVPSAAANVLYPRMLERFAASNDPEAVSALLLNPVRAMAALMIVLAGATVVLLPALIRLALPKYIPAIPLIEILVPGSYFLGLAPVAGSYVIALNHQRDLIKIQLVAISSSLAIDGLLLYAGAGIRGVAFGTVACYAVYGLGYLGLATFLARRKSGEALSALAQLIAPFLALVAGVKATALVIPEPSGWVEELSLTGTRLVIVTAAVALVVWLVNRKSGIFSAVRIEFVNWRTSRAAPR